ncbi:integral peroxisomal membrane peroxin-domain-containing protein [Russula earlei]|uniref:Integral peroxisomal membrane peroxin-domain-containing protein n=1 Tax=Russula earlei TaxID=71964 RepID=A0ACC0TST9_9AGAM|nr:integral peroxisomal membrane peroxin-domain-containing protein [Russula earlei]
MSHQAVSQPQTPEPQEIPDESGLISQQVHSLAGAPTLIDFLHTVPAPLVALLVRLAPPVSFLRHVSQIISWQTPRIDACLLLALWWAAVLFADTALRYLLPIMIGSAVACLRRREPKYVAHPMTEASVQGAIKDLAALLVLLPSIPTLPAFLSSSALPSDALLRACAIASIIYLVLTYLVPLRIMIGIFGTVFLTYRAPFAQLLRAALWRSAFVRRTIYHSWAWLTGIPVPSPSTTNDQVSTQRFTNTEQHRFAFTVYENQRWWMGLDWTAVLLPGERPSWCSASQAPLPPPAGFALPAPTTAFLPIGGAPDTREQRTATWAWADPEWRIVVRRVGEQPADVEEENTENTDGNGWVYGDNKWECHSDKGGLGKYTRYRRWTRIALLKETTERVGQGPTGVLREDGKLQPLDMPTSTETKEKNEKEKSNNLPGSGPSTLEMRTSVVLGAVGSGLKQRLHAAVSGAH